jgi:alginate O-acetyltransferase complex protein AlgI
MGFDLILNFRLPYFALSPGEFWRRWHISLSTWLRDYLYIPLGGNRGTEFQTFRNLMITMLLGGLWHGAAWNFVLWGAYHGAILVIYRVVAPNVGSDNPWRGRYSALVVLPQMLLMFSLTLMGWFLFRAESFHQIGYMLSHAGLEMSVSTLPFARKLVFFVAPLILLQIVQYAYKDLLVPLRFPLTLQIPLYAFLVLMMLMFGNVGGNEFIYFQF